MKKPENFELIIHIGTGKTGTTSIQESLIANEDWLHANNTNYFGLMIERVSKKHFDWQRAGDIHHLNDLEGIDRTQAQKQLQETIFTEIKNITKQGIKRAIWSNESIFETSDFVIPVLLYLIKQGINVKIIVYIRRHDAWLRSAYIQWGIKHKTYEGQLQSFNQWINGRIPHFSSKLKPWLEQKNQWTDLSVHNFDTCGDIVKDFFEYYGLYHPEMTIIRSNNSPNAVCLNAWAMYNAQFEEMVLPHNMEMLLAESGLINKNLQEINLEELLPSQEDMENILLLTREDRDAINKIFEQFSQPKMDISTQTIKQQQVTQDHMNTLFLFMLKNQLDRIHHLEYLVYKLSN
ncbi:MAG: hypothetical protein WAX77_14310 [Methylococcaceae bacterium]